MRMIIQNFGGINYLDRSVESWRAANGAGKTSFLNAYVWALTGRALTGFEPINIGIASGESDASNEPGNRFTAVSLFGGFLHDFTIHRRHVDGITTLYVNDTPTTQTAFNAIIANLGYDIDFIRACADANILCDSALTSADLRKLLTVTGMKDDEDMRVLRKQAETIRKKRNEAEKYALSNIAVPEAVILPPSQSQIEMMNVYNEALYVKQQGIPPMTCPRCGRDRDKYTLDREKMVYMKAVETVKRLEREYNAIMFHKRAYEDEQATIADIRRLLDASKRARDDVKTYDKQLQDIDAEIRRLDAEAVSDELPEGVEVITETTAATSGNTKSVCTLTVDGVPLKSVNRARRIEICVRMLDRARTIKGMQAVPIWIDNAEAITGCADVPNVIRLIVE